MEKLISKQFFLILYVTDNLKKRQKKNHELCSKTTYFLKNYWTVNIIISCECWFQIMLLILSLFFNETKCLTENQEFTTEIKQKQTIQAFSQVFLRGRRGVHSTLWKYPTSWKSILHFVYVFRAEQRFLAKFWSPDTSFNENILTPLNSNFKTFVHAQIATTHYNVLFINFLNLYESENYVG